MKILITGFPGTGKSAIARELKQRGYTAYDPQAMRNYMHLQDPETGRHIQMPANPARGWFDASGAYNWDIPRLSRLIEQDETVFICSLADNMDASYHLFNKIFVLVLDDFELEQRLRQRQKPLDSVPEQLADTLTLHRHFEQRLIDQGAVAINVHPSVEVVVDRILESCWSET